MSRLLISSNSGRGTGFGRIAAGIARALAPDYQVQVIGLGSPQIEENWQSFPTHPLDPCHISTVAWAAVQCAPQVIILIGPGSVLAQQVTRLRRDKFPGKIVSYVPIEGAVRNALPLLGLRQSDTVVAYTAYGAAMLARALRWENPSDDNRLTVVAHAIDAPPALVGATSRPQLRRALFPEFAHRAEGTWVLNANRHDGRKCPELTLRAFAAVAATHPEITLVLHGQPERQGFDLRREAERLGVQEKVIFTRELQTEPWPEERLTQLYTSCEIGVNSALGEGWGLVAFEHALCGGAQIMPAHENLQEIWGDIPEWIPVQGTIPLDDVFVGQLLDSEFFAATLKQLVEQSEHAGEIATRCGTHASDIELSWERVGDAWNNLIRYNV